MFAPSHTAPLLMVVGIASIASATLFYPNPQAAILEHILVDTHGAHSSGFADAITPCSNYVSGNQQFGRETAAQWLRVSFHDFVTANVTAGTGGIDASIGFETLREENSGSAMNDSLGFFRPYVNSQVSMADLIALSVAMSVGNCGGPQIPVRGGRIDAIRGGGTGVPAPETSLEETLVLFERAGFSQVDSIGLTACGHTMGSVHHGGFPTVVGPEAVSVNNTAGGIHFDSTVDVFDTLVLNEYLDGTGNQGGPLVTSFNVSSRSDLRLYESDNNVTITKLRGQGKDFFNTCVTLFQRMIETVPKGVVLSDVVSPMSIKPINVSLDFDTNGNLVLNGYIRTLTPTGTIPPTTLTLTVPNHPKSHTLSPEPETGYSIFGATTFFPISLNIQSPKTLTSITISGFGSAQTFSLQTTAFIIPSLSFAVTTNSTTIVNFTVAVSSEGPYRRSLFSKTVGPKVRIRVPVGQQGTLSPKIKTFDNVSISRSGSKANYELWAGSIDVVVLATGALSISLLDAVGKEIDVAFF